MTLVTTPTPQRQPHLLRRTLPLSLAVSLYRHVPHRRQHRVLRKRNTFALLANVDSRRAAILQDMSGFIRENATMRAHFLVVKRGVPGKTTSNNSKPFIIFFRRSELELTSTAIASTFLQVLVVPETAGLPVAAPESLCPLPRARRPLHPHRMQHLARLASHPPPKPFARDTAS